LEPANPYTPILQEDTDEWAPLDWVSTDDEPGVEELRKLVAPLKWIPPRIVEVTDIPTLKIFLMAAPKEKLAGKCTSRTHLEVWKATCGGDRFMELGMMTYWKDRIQSPQTLIGLKAGVQRKFKPGEEAEYDKLLQEQLDEGIVVEVPDDWPCYVSPVNIVPKHGVDENGNPTLAWRMIWDSRVVNAEQVDIHFKMDGPQTIQRLMQRGDWMTRFDLKSAFNHLRVHDSMKKFLCWRYNGRREDT
jgi:hypothetical protein